MSLAHLFPQRAELPSGCSQRRPPCGRARRLAVREAAPPWSAPARTSAPNCGVTPCEPAGSSLAAQTLRGRPFPEPPRSRVRACHLDTGQPRSPRLLAFRRAAAGVKPAGFRRRAASPVPPPVCARGSRTRRSPTAESSPLANRRWEMGHSWAKLEALDFKGNRCSGACCHFSTSDLLPFTEPFLSRSLHVGGRGPQQRPLPESVLTGVWRFPRVPVAAPGGCNGPVQSRMSSFSSCLQCWTARGMVRSSGTELHNRCLA